MCVVVVVIIVRTILGRWLDELYIYYIIAAYRVIIYHKN